jgi:hypothetical protein
MKSPPSNICVLEGFWCNTAIKLSSPVQTPLGSRVTLIKVCVDIKFSIDKDIILHVVELSQPKGGGLASCNMSSVRRGEAWRALGTNLAAESLLQKAVRGDLADERCRLRKLMLKVWHNRNRETFGQSLADSLNSGTSPEAIEGLIRTFGQGIPVVFLYTKEDGTAERRRVFVMGASGECL